MQIPEHYPPILADMATLFRARLGQHLPDSEADVLTLACVDDLCLTFSGSQIYIPKREAMSRAHRDSLIVREFDGHNHADLAKRYHLTVTQIYDIIARRRTARRADA